MRNCFNFIRHLAVVVCISSASAGSYEDFFRAVIQDNPRVISDLLQRGFDPNVPDPKGQTGLNLALQLSSLKVADMLADAPQTKVEQRNAQDESPLMMAAHRGNLAIARKLIARDADVNKTGWTPLHYAATGGHTQMIELLLEHNAYIDAESPNGSTPLMMAAQYGSTESVKLLLASGADASLKNQLGLTALDFARRGNRPDAIELLGKAVQKTRPVGHW